jgi:predicted dehydrogenase
MTAAPRLRLAILGVSGYLARVAFPSLLQEPSLQVVAIGARDPASALAKLPAEVANSVSGIGGLEECLSRPEVDAVYITMPNGLHIDWIMRSLLAGKHVLCEKPISARTGELQAAFLEAGDRGLILREGQMFRYHPLWSRVTELIYSGALGTPALAESHYAYLDNDFSGPRFRRELDGGAFNMIGTYPVAATLLFFGERPQRVTALGRYLPDLGTDRALGAVLEFETGFGLISASVDAFDTQSFRLTGSRASLQCSWPFNPAPEQTVALELSNGSGQFETLPVLPADQFALQFRHFASEVQFGVPPVVSPGDSLDCTAVMEAISLSASNGGAVTGVTDSP